MEFEWVVDNKQSLKNFLKTKYVSHRLFNKIKHGDGKVLVNGKVKFAGEVKESQKVKLILPSEKSDENIIPSFEPVNVVYEDRNWIVVDKQAGLNSVLGPSNRSDTLVNRLKGYLLKTGSDNLKPHIITRLDRFTSGLVLIAKHALAQATMDKIKNPKIEKRYLALVEGKINRLHFKIEKPLLNLKGEIKQQVSSKGKYALSEFWIKEEFANQTLLEVKLHTGRTHQIRAHLADFNHPIVGDELYGGSTDRIKRQALHSFKLNFLDPFSMKMLYFESKLPSDIDELIK